MFSRRTTYAVSAATLLLAAGGCRYFRPIDPATGSANPPIEEAATETAPQARPAANQPSSAQERPASARRSGSERLSDANIAAMIMALNNTDISYARLVPARSERDDVKRFAARMLTDHAGVNALVQDLLAKLDMGAEDNVASLDMRDESAERRDVLRELSGYKFDSTYIENEVDYHRKYLASIDTAMSPAARAIEVQGLLNSIRPAVAAHLAHAEQVRANVIAKR